MLVESQCLGGQGNSVCKFPDEHDLTFQCSGTFTVPPWRLSVPTAIDRDEVLRLVEQAGAQLVEVLPQDEYDEEHLDGAIHLPLKSLTMLTAGVLDRGRPVITYCWDGL